MCDFQRKIQSQFGKHLWAFWKYLQNSKKCCKMTSWVFQESKSRCRAMWLKCHDHTWEVRCGGWLQTVGLKKEQYLGDRRSRWGRRERSGGFNNRGRTLHFLPSTMFLTAPLTTEHLVCQTPRKPAAIKTLRFADYLHIKRNIYQHEPSCPL